MATGSTRPTPQETSAAQQAVINGLLRLGIEPISLHEQLEGALDEILTIPWLPFQSTAAIFLTGEEPEVLELAVARNLPPACGRIPFGHCHCGRAAAARSPQFVATCTGDPHDPPPLGRSPHGHYSLPLLHGQRLLGVLTLYLAGGHTPTDGELPFLEAVANAVAKIIAHARVEEELVEAMERAGEASRVKSAFLAVIGHEIRTPLNGVLGMVDLLLHTELTGQQEGYARAARSSATALLTLLNDCLELAKIESGQLERERRALDPLEVVATALEVVAPLAMEKNVGLVSIADGDLPATVVGDPVRLRHLLVNLVGNAVKFTEAWGEVVVEVGSKRLEGGALLYVAVRDTGVGMSPELVPRLFEPFVQADSSSTRKHGGSGVGLALCRTLVERMGGEIGVESILGEGTTIRFSVPVDQPASPVSLPPQLSATSILVTPATSPIVPVVVEQLRRWGVTLVWAASLERAMTVVEQGGTIGRPTEILIVDRDHTPRLAELYRHLQSLPAASHPAVLEIGWGGAGARSSGAPAILAFHRLPKPLHPASLHRALARLLDDKGDHDSLPAAASGGRRLPSARILIAEDNPVNQQVMVHMVSQLGHEAVVVANGAEAVAAVADGGFDLVLMDHQMPVMAGDEAAVRIRAAELPGHHIPIIAVTATALESTREACLRAGMDGYLVKPVTRELLADTLRQWLPARRPASDGGVR